MTLPSRKTRKKKPPKRTPWAWPFFFFGFIFALGALTERNLGGLLATLTLWSSLGLLLRLWPVSPSRKVLWRWGASLLVLALGLLSFAWSEGVTADLYAFWFSPEWPEKATANYRPEQDALVAGPKTVTSETAAASVQSFAGEVFPPTVLPPENALGGAGRSPSLFAVPVGVEPGETIPVIVTRVVDPVTLVVDGKVRLALAGLAPPAKESPAHDQAMLYLKIMLEGEEAEVAFSPYNRDSQELFALVWQRGELLNLALLERGLAKVDKTRGSSFDLSLWAEREKLAQRARRGLWGIEKASPESWVREQRPDPKRR